LKPGVGDQMRAEIFRPFLSDLAAPKLVPIRVAPWAAVADAGPSVERPERRALGQTQVADWLAAD
jgi:hypothetical protein